MTSTPSPGETADQTQTPASAAAPAPRRNLWLTLFTLALAALLLYLALRGVDWRAFLGTISRGRYYLLPFLFILVSLNYFVRALRWRVLLSADRPIPPLTVFWANMAGYLGNSFLPARAGELVRSLALGHKAAIDASFVLATALTERLLDVIALVLISALALLSMPGISPAFANALQGMAVLAGVGLLFVLLAPRFSLFFQRLLAALPFPASLRPRLESLLSRFLDGMRSLQDFRRLAFFVALTAFVWIVDGLGTMLGAYMLRLHLTLPQALLLLAGLGLSSAIPSTPGYVGVYQFVAVTMLSPFGFSKSDALAYILVAQAFNYVIVTVWGLPGLLLSRK